MVEFVTSRWRLLCAIASLIVIAVLVAIDLQQDVKTIEPRELTYVGAVNGVEIHTFSNTFGEWCTLARRKHSATGVAISCNARSNSKYAM